MKSEHKAFYLDILKALQANNLAIFAGAGMSKSAGYVDWKGLLKDIAEELGLDIELESDLITIAQYQVNASGGRSKLNQKIIEEFNSDIEITETHRILARLPIRTYWTSNYDDLIETSILDVKRIPDVKHTDKQLFHSRPRRDAVVYKMHGDKTMPGDAVITKDDYERYHIDHQLFVTTLSADLVSKLFLFVGFSFTDPNMDYILSRIRVYMKGETRHHYYFIKKIKEDDPEIKKLDVGKRKAQYEYLQRKQELFVQDLKRFQLQPVWVEAFHEIQSILEEIEYLFKKKTVFISGSAEIYGSWDKTAAQIFIHNLSKRLVKENLRIVNGFGWGIGSAVINGALEQIFLQPNRYSEDQLIVKPFPQYATGEKSLTELWHEYRENMIAFAGIAIFLFGNKNVAETIVPADGVYKEFQIAKELKLFPIPVASTGFMSEQISTELINEGYYTEPILSIMNSLSHEKDPEQIIEKIIIIIKHINQ